MFWIVLAAAAAGADLLIKAWIRKNKDLNSSMPLAGGKIVITKVFNPGAMLGFLKERAALLAGITLFMLGLLVGFLLALAGRKGTFLLKLGVSLILGGAGSNAFERLAYGKVTDYFRLNLGSKRLARVVFNIGDFCIFAGCLLAMLGSAFAKQR